MLRNYTRWRTRGPGVLVADLLGCHSDIAVNTTTALVEFNGHSLTPDEARLIGVRLIDAAVLADGDRAIREPSTT